MHAQNWQLFPLNQETYFEFEQIDAFANGGDRLAFGPYYMDSISTIGDSTQYHLFVERMIAESELGPCTDFFTEVTRFNEVLDPLKEKDGVFYHGQEGNILQFNSLSEVGDSWDYSSSSSSFNIDFFRITCDGFGVETFLEINDSVKYFSVQAFLDNAPVDHKINTAVYVLSKNYGFIEFTPFRYLKQLKPMNGKLIGLIDNDILLGEKSTVDFSEFFPNQIGDVHVIYVEENNWDFIPPLGYQETNFYEIINIVNTDSTYGVSYGFSFVFEQAYVDLFFDINEGNNWIESTYWGIVFDESTIFDDTNTSVTLSRDANDPSELFLGVGDFDFWCESGDCCLNLYGCREHQLFSTLRGKYAHSGSCETGQEAYWHVEEIVSQDSMVIDVTVLLEGAIDPDGNSSSPMATNLNELIPQDQPYDVAPYNYAGTEISSVDFSQNHNFVDWVLVELRTGIPDLAERNTASVHTMAALLHRSGKLYGSDGRPGLRFPTLDPNEDYHLLVRHRNHLDVLSAVAETGRLLKHNFSGNSSAAFGSEQLNQISGNRAAMRAADIHPDGIIQVTDFDQIEINMGLQDLYIPADINLDGVVDSLDYQIWKPNRARFGTPEIGF